MSAVPEAVERARHSWWVLLARLVFRFVAGRDLTGERKTTATFLRPGEALTSHPLWWFQHHPGHRRARFRALSLLTAAVVLYLHLAAPAVLMWLLEGSGVLSVPVLGTALWTYAQTRQHWGRFGAGALAWMRESYGRQVSVSVPRVHLDDPEHPAVLKFPPGHAFSEAEKDKVARKAADKLGLPDYTPEWDLVGRPVLRISTAPLPPARVNIADKIAVLEQKTAAGKLYLGEGSRKHEVFLDLDIECPHCLVSAGTGGGKSVTWRGLTAQILHGGGAALVCDVKRISHMWAKDLPNVSYCRDDEAIHYGIIEFAEEVARRNRIVDAHADIDGNVDPSVIGPRIVLLLEEINATQAILRAYWNRVRGPGDPPQSPAITALHAVLFMGRAVLAHVFTAGQQVSARTLGGGEARENFGARIIARATKNTWKMLAPETANRGKFPAALKGAGGVHLVLNGEATACRVAWWTNEEARAYALSGVVTEYRDAVRPGTVLRVESQVTRDETGDSDALVSLRDAHELHEIGASVGALRRASTRPGFPDAADAFGDKKLYDLDELRRWQENRVRPREVEMESAR